MTLERGELDITSAEQVTAVIDRLRPEVIINCAAYNAVDAAETNRAAAFALNAHGPALLAASADTAGAVFVHFSSDFVFDGEAGEVYTEAHPTNPLNVYGASKLAGEAAARFASRHYILRVSSLFGGVGRNGHRATVDYIADGLPLPGNDGACGGGSDRYTELRPDVRQSDSGDAWRPCAVRHVYCANPTAARRGTNWRGRLRGSLVAVSVSSRYEPPI